MHINPTSIDELQAMRKLLNVIHEEHMRRGKTIVADSSTDLALTMGEMLRSQGWGECIGFIADYLKGELAVLERLYTGACNQ